MSTTQLPNPDFFHFGWWVGRVTWTGHFCECGLKLSTVALNEFLIYNYIQVEKKDKNNKKIKIKTKTKKRKKIKLKSKI